MKNTKQLLSNLFIVSNKSRGSIMDVSNTDIYGCIIHMDGLNISTKSTKESRVTGIMSELTIARKIKIIIDLIKWLF